MTATVQNNGAWTPISEVVLPIGIARALAANAQIGRGQFGTVAPATGYSALNDGTVPNQLGAGMGWPNELSDTSTVAAAAAAQFREGWSYGNVASTIASDGFTDADFGVVFWIKDENTPGKLSNSSGSNRSMGGLAFGLAFDGTPVIWTGAVAALMARCVHSSTNESAGTIAYAQDATASTTQGTAADPLIIPRKKLHGTITSIEIIPSADLALALTNYRVITLYKINTLTNVVGPTVGTFSTLTQNLAKRTPTQFTLSSTATDLDMLETDILGFASLVTASGATVPQSVIRANLKVQ